jgi:hypothetical protein
MPEHTLTDVTLPINNQRLCIMSLLAAFAYARELGDPALCGYIKAVLKRAENPTADGIEPATTQIGDRFAQRLAAQRHGWAICVETIDKWHAPEDDRGVEALCREIYRIGINSGIDSIMGEWADQSLRHFAADLTLDPKADRLL